MTLAKLRQILDELSVERDGNDDLPVVFFGEREAGEIENDTQTPAFVKREVEKAISDIFELRGGSL